MKITAQRRKAYREVKRILNSINFGTLAAKVEADLRRQDGRHGTTWIILNHFAPNVPKPAGIY